jgi:hypothetical protein
VLKHDQKWAISYRGDIDAIMKALSLFVLQERGILIYSGAIILISQRLNITGIIQSCCYDQNKYLFFALL